MHFDCMMRSIVGASSEHCDGQREIGGHAWQSFGRWTASLDACRLKRVEVVAVGSQPDQVTFFTGDYAPGSKHESLLLNNAILWALLAEAACQVLVPICEKALGRVWCFQAVAEGVSSEIDFSILVVSMLGVVFAGLAGPFTEEHNSQNCSGMGDESMGESGNAGTAIGGMPSEVLVRNEQLLQGSTTKHLSAGFMRGFVPIFNSYVAVVEHVGDLIRDGEFRAGVAVFIVIFFGGPILYTLVLLATRLALARWRSSLAQPQERCVVIRNLRIIQVVLGLALVAITALGFAANPLRSPEPMGPSPRHMMSATARALWWELPCGLMCVLIAFWIAERLEVVTDSWKTNCRHLCEESVHFPSVAANALSLALGHLLFLIESLVAAPEILAGLARVHFSAVSAISSYGGFAVSVGESALRGEWRASFANLAINCYIAALGAAIVLIR